MAKLTQFEMSADQTGIELYQWDTHTVIIEWDGERRVVHGFHEADCVYSGDSTDKCGEAIGLDSQQMCGLLGSDVTYMVRR